MTTQLKARIARDSRNKALMNTAHHCPTMLPSGRSKDARLHAKPGRGLPPPEAMPVGQIPARRERENQQPAYEAVEVNLHCGPS
jgi:hypothetical protein